MFVFCFCCGAFGVIGPFWVEVAALGASGLRIYGFGFRV